MNDQQKQKLAKLYSQIATPAEKEELRNLLKMKGWKMESDKVVENLSTDLQSKVAEVEQAVKTVKKEVRQNTQNMSASIVDAFEKLAETIKGLGGTITTSYEKNKAPDMSGFFKDIGTQLAQIGGSSKRTSDLITNLKWNSSMGVRNSDGSPIDPSTSYKNATVTPSVPVGTLLVFDNAGTIAKVSNTVGLPVTVLSGSVSVSSASLVGLRVSTKSPLTASAPTSATVGVASAQAVASNASRKGLVLINTSNNYISLGLGATAVLYSGITLAPYGVYNMSEYDFATGAINAIASSAGSNLAIQEFT